MSENVNCYILSKFIHGEGSILSASINSIIALFFFLILSIEEGFFVRPVYLPMGAFIVFNIRNIYYGSRVMPAAFIYVIYVVFSISQSLDPGLSTKFAIHASFTMLFGLSSVGYLTGKKVEVFCWWFDLYIISGIITSIFTIFQFVFFVVFPAYSKWWVGPVPRAYAMATEPSYLAFFLVPIFFVAFSNSRYRAAALIALATFLTTSRTGIIGLVGGGIGLVFIQPRKFGRLAWQTLKYSLLVSVLLLLVPAVQRGVSTFIEFLLSGFQNLDVGSAYTRLLSWLYAWELFLENPIFGVGVQGYGPAMHEKGMMLNHPAEQVRTTMLYLEILAEYGIVGFLVFVWWLFSPIFTLWRHRTDERAAGLLAALGSMLVMFPFIQNWWRPYLWIAWVLSYVLAYHYKNEFEK